MIKLHGIEYEYRSGIWYEKESGMRVNNESLQRTLTTMWFDGNKKK